MSTMAACSAGRTNLVSGHRKGVNVTLFGRVAVRQVKLRWVEQFGCHVTENTGLRGCRATRFHDGGICDDTRDPAVSQACRAILADQDVSLRGRTRINV